MRPSHFIPLVLTTAILLLFGCENNDSVSPENNDSVSPQEHLPTITTAEITDITPYTAIGGGDVTDDGGYGIIARGIVWGRFPNPTLDNNKTNDGSGTGSFTSEMTDLKSNSAYHVRAYATNSKGTAYGNQVSFRAVQDTGTVTDIDGNIYKTVKLGDQWWMAENLRTSRYRNGVTIPNVTDLARWSNLTTGAWVNYDNNASYDIVYGKLYNWYAVIDTGGLCPDDWHVPSDGEWRELEIHLGMTEQQLEDPYREGSDAGGILKSTRTEPDPHPRWSNPNTGANNESKFSGLPGGVRGSGINFIQIGITGSWWSSTEYNTRSANSRSLYYNHTGIFGTNEIKEHGHSIRCLRYD
jgi:uncharacterized protein (TIGR02145 family)